MKKALCVLVVSATVILLAQAVYAVSTTDPITVTATINAGTPDMTVKIYKAPNGDWQLINWNAPVGTMAFDKFTVLQRPGKNPQWTTVDQFVAFVYADGQGKRYQIKSSGNGQSFIRTGGSETLPSGSFGCTPVYSPDDKWKYPDGTEMVQGAMPGGASVGGAGNAASTAPVTIYTSENPGTARILQAWYGFPPYTVTGTDPYNGYNPIPSNQINGTYTGVNVTLTISAI